MTLQHTVCCWTINRLKLNNSLQKELVSVYLHHQNLFLLSVTSALSKLFHQYVYFCLQYCYQNSDHSTMNKTCCSELQWFFSADNASNGCEIPRPPPPPADSLFIFRNFQQKKQHFQNNMVFPVPINQCLSNPNFLPLTAQVLFNQCNVTGLRGSGCTGSYRRNRFVFALYCLGCNMIYGI